MDISTIDEIKDRNLYQKYEMKTKALDETNPTDKLKNHYKKMYKWLRSNPEISFRKLNPIGFQIDIRTVPSDKESEFIEISTFKNN